MAVIYLDVLREFRSFAAAICKRLTNVVNGLSSCVLSVVDAPPALLG